MRGDKSAHGNACVAYLNLPAHILVCAWSAPLARSHLLHVSNLDSLFAAAGTPKDAVNRLFDPSAHFTPSSFSFFPSILLTHLCSNTSVHWHALRPNDQLMCRAGTYRRIFGGNDCQQQPDTIITKCRGSKDHEYWCAFLSALDKALLWGRLPTHHCLCSANWQHALLQGECQHMYVTKREGGWLCLLCA